VTKIYKEKMTGSAPGTFWAYRDEQYNLGKDNGLKSFPVKACYAAVSIVCD
jgi:hypothetical protein